MVPPQVKEFLGGGFKSGVRFTYMVQEEPKGIAHAVNCSEEFIDKDPFVMYLGDDLLKIGIRTISKIKADEKADCVIFFMPVSEYRANRETVTTACVSRPRSRWMSSTRMRLRSPGH